MNNKIDIKAELVEKVSKSGNPYKVVILHLTDTLEKPVFLEKSEEELVNYVYFSNNSKKEEQTPFDF